jgi:hypothetical protein
MYFKILDLDKGGRTTLDPNSRSLEFKGNELGKGGEDFSDESEVREDEQGADKVKGCRRRRQSREQKRKRSEDLIVTTMSFRSPVSGLRHRPPSSSTFGLTLLSSPLFQVTSSVSDSLVSISSCTSTQPERHRASRNDQHHAKPLGPWTPSLP